MIFISQIYFYSLDSNHMCMKGPLGKAVFNISIVI
jgi:hypothetical protein